ncbi:MAG: protein kinase [Myxococcota bacterium]
MAGQQVVQHCPVCNAKYDVGIYVSGQKVRCRKCGNKFAVIRNDTFVGAAPGAVPAGGSAAFGAGGAVAGAAVPGAAAAGGLALAAGAVAVAKEAPKWPKNPGPTVAERPRDPPQVRRDKPTQDRDLPVGTRLDGYELGPVLGKGAMGTVYRARQLSLDRTVAVKVMASDLVGQPEFVLRFRREAAALAALSHPNVVAIIDQGNVGPHYYFVMEFVDGPTLRRELAKKAVGHEFGLELAIQIGRGLVYAHSKGIVHRDLKPENVLLADDGVGRVAKICDFGLADILFSDRSYVNLTGSRISMGTVNYMAPEQRQDAGRVDQRADIFSYGVVVYELLTGELPIGRFPTPAERNTALDRRLDPVVLRALDQDPRRRYPFVREMVDKIEAVARGRL